VARIVRVRVVLKRNVLGDSRFDNLSRSHFHSEYLTITAEIHVRSLAKFNGQYADRHMNLKFVSERERESRQSVMVKNVQIDVSF